MIRIRTWALPAVILLLLWGISLPAKPNDSGYKVIKTIKLGGEGG